MPRRRGAGVDGEGRRHAFPARWREDPGSRTAASRIITSCSPAPGKRRAPKDCRHLDLDGIRRDRPVAERILRSSRRIPLARLRFDVLRVLINRLGKPSEGTRSRWRRSTSSAQRWAPRGAPAFAARSALRLSSIRRLRASCSARAGRPAGQHLPSDHRGHAAKSVTARLVYRAAWTQDQGAAQSPAAGCDGQDVYVRLRNGSSIVQVQIHGGAGVAKASRSRSCTRGSALRHLRGRNRGAEDRDRARGVEGTGRENQPWRLNRRRRMAQSGHIDTFARDHLPPRRSVA